MPRYGRIERDYGMRLAGTDPAAFTVEGTILGDGRPWTGARYTRVDDTVALPAGDDHHQVLLLRPLIERWA